MGATVGTNPKLQLNQDLANDVISSVKRTFECFFCVDVVPEKHEFKTEFSKFGDVSAAMDMEQDSNEATMFTAFEGSTILGIVSKFYGQNFVEINKSVLDGVGEITNSVYGLIKQRLNARQYKFKMSIPRIDVGGERPGDVLHKGQTLIVHFRTEFGSFQVGIALSSKGE